MKMHCNIKDNVLQSTQLCALLHHQKVEVGHIVRHFLFVVSRSTNISTFREFSFFLRATAFLFVESISGTEISEFPEEKHLSKHFPS